MADLRAFFRWLRETRGAHVSPFDLGPPAIEAYRAYLQQAKTHAPATVNRRLQTLRKFYSFAVARGWAATNPAEEVALLSEVASERSRFLTREDVGRLLAAVKQGRRRWVDRDLAIMHVFLRGGLKLRELTGLRLADVRFDSTAPHLRVRGMGREDVPERLIPMDGELDASLRRYLRARHVAPGVEHVFANRDGKPLSTRSVQRLLHYYAGKSDLNGLTTQALRYRFAVDAYESSEDLEEVARLLGHRHLATTIRYLRPTLLNGDGHDGDDPIAPLERRVESGSAPRKRPVRTGRG